MMLFTIELDSLQVKEVVLNMFFSHNSAKIKMNSYDSLPLEKTLTLHNVIILINSVLNKDKNHYYYNIPENPVNTPPKYVTQLTSQI